MLGNWGKVWDSFDRKKKIIGIEPVEENDGVDMFEQTGVAAE